MTHRFLNLGLSLSLMAFLAACGNGTNPVSGGDDDDDGAIDRGANTETDAVFADQDLLVLNNVFFDEDTDELILNDVPFDGVEGIYERTNVTLAGSNAGIFANIDGELQYFAIFQRSENAQTLAVATDDLVASGFGGVSAQNLSNSVNLPNEGEFVYIGTYAATRVTREADGTPNAGDLQFVTADMRLIVDIEDFAGTGAVQGSTDTRTVFDQNGAFLRETGGISLTTANIDFETDTIDSSTATGFTIDPDTDALVESQSGTYEGVFAGSDGQEIAGIIILGGSNEAGDTIVETGGFIVDQQ